MKKHSFGYVCTVAAILGMGALAACEKAEEDEDQTRIGASQGAWFIFANPFAGPTPPPETPNPISATLTGSAEVFTLEEGKKTKVRLDLTGLPPSRVFGAHVHKLSCAEMKAGPHYQHTEFPATTVATDNTYANAANEIWLDFQTDAQGRAIREVTQQFRIVSERAKAVILHDLLSSNDPGKGGTAGARLACINLAVN